MFIICKYINKQSVTGLALPLGKVRWSPQAAGAVPPEPLDILFCWRAELWEEFCVVLCLLFHQSKDFILTNGTIPYLPLPTLWSSGHSPTLPEPILEGAGGGRRKPHCADFHWWDLLVTSHPMCACTLTSLQLSSVVDAVPLPVLKWDSTSNLVSYVWNEGHHLVHLLQQNVISYLWVVFSASPTQRRPTKINGPKLLMSTHFNGSTLMRISTEHSTLILHVYPTFPPISSRLHTWFPPLSILSSQQPCKVG